MARPKKAPLQAVEAPALPAPDVAPTPQSTSDSDVVTVRCHADNIWCGGRKLLRGDVAQRRLGDVLACGEHLEII